MVGQVLLREGYVYNCPCISKPSYLSYREFSDGSELIVNIRYKRDPASIGFWK